MGRRARPESLRPVLRAYSSCSTYPSCRTYGTYPSCRTYCTYRSCRTERVTVNFGSWRTMVVGPTVLASALLWRRCEL